MFDQFCAIQILMQMEEVELELEGLESVYGQENVKYRTEGSTIVGHICVESKPVEKTPKLKTIRDGVETIVEVPALSPVVLAFVLESSYPNVKPQFEIESKWMNKQSVTNLKKKLNEVCEEYSGYPVLSFCYEAVFEFVAQLVDTEEVFDLTHLNAVEFSDFLENCELADQNTFESQCHDCDICFTNQTGSNFVKFRPCSHIFCKQCCQSYFMDRMKSVQVKQLECLASDCTSTAASRVVKEILGEEEYDRYENILLQNALNQMIDVVVCARSSCQQPANISEQVRYLAICSVCEFAFCILCRKVFHGINKCRFTVVHKNAMIDCWENGTEEEKLKMSQHFGGLQQFKIAVENIKSEFWIEGQSRECPRCRIPIEKNEGCNKMLCVQCGCAFCWLCNAVLDKNNPYNHFTDVSNGPCFNRLFEFIDEAEEIPFDFDVDDDDDDEDTDDTVHSYDYDEDDSFASGED